MNNLERKFTGAIERQQTPQDVMLASFTPSTRPEVYMPAFLGTIEDQKYTPSCGAHAGQSLKQILENFRGSPEYLWKKIKLVDGFPPEDGTNMLSIMKTLQKTGICSIESMPNDSFETITDYTDPSDLTPALDSEAFKHRVGVYAFTWNPTLEQLKQAIYDHKAVIMLLRVGAEWWTNPQGINSWREADIMPLRTNIPITSGHFVTAFAYDSQYIYFVNEWSTSWARNGIGYFSSDYMSRCVEIGTTVNDNTKYIFTKVLRFGSIGFDVKQLQLKLGITADGIFGPNTRNAVIAYQTKHQLKPDGIVGRLTCVVLNL